MPLPSEASSPSAPSAAGEPRRVAFSNTGLKPVERVSTASVVARQLLEELAQDGLVSGTRLPSERELADTLGVGRSTLREAMAALDLLGIIEVRPGSGSYLKADSSKVLPQALSWGLGLGRPEVQHLVEVREHLELLAASLAAARSSDDDLERLRAHVEQMRSAGDDVELFVEADIAFHLEIAVIAQNSVLEGILVSIRSLLHAWFERTLNVEGTMGLTVPEHEAVLRAIEAHDSAGAERTMKVLMDHADARLKQTL
jgi:GntR family transcriptional repressor for pyruvate dehydrogenase complex